MMMFGRSIAREAVVKVGLLVLFMVLTVLLLGQCEKRREEAAQARLDKELNDARVGSGADAIGTVTNRGAAEMESENLTRNNERDIRAAPGASDRVNSGVDLAGRKALCKRAAYKDTPQCKELMR